MSGSDQNISVDPLRESRTMDQDCQDDDMQDGSGKKVIVGICAMGKKSNSKPMREILTRMEEFEYITTIIFPEDVILKVSICCSIVGSLVSDAHCNQFDYIILIV